MRCAVCRRQTTNSICETINYIGAIAAVMPEDLNVPRTTATAAATAAAAAQHRDQMANGEFITKANRYDAKKYEVKYCTQYLYIKIFKWLERLWLPQDQFFSSIVFRFFMRIYIVMSRIVGLSVFPFYLAQGNKRRNNNSDKSSIKRFMLSHSGHTVYSAVYSVDIGDFQLPCARALVQYSP